MCCCCCCSCLLACKNDHFWWEFFSPPYAFSFFFDGFLFRFLLWMSQQNDINILVNCCTPEATFMLLFIPLQRKNSFCLRLLIGSEILSNFLFVICLDFQATTLNGLDYICNHVKKLFNSVATFVYDLFCKRTVLLHNFLLSAFRFLIFIWIVIFFSFVISLVNPEHPSQFYFRFVSPLRSVFI